jgi:hypothetical protein
MVRFIERSTQFHAKKPETGGGALDGYCRGLEPGRTAKQK